MHRLQGARGSIWFVARTAVALGLAISPLSAGAETLNEVVGHALVNSPLIKAAQSQEIAARTDIDQARASHLPSLEMTVNTGRRTTETAIVHDSVSLKEKVTTITLSQNIFSGGAVVAEVGRQTARADSVDSRGLETRNQVALNSVEIYIACLKATKLLVLSEKNVAAHREVVAKVSSIVSSDRGRRYELTQAKARLAGAESLRVLRARGVVEAENQFLRIVGRKPAELADITKAPALPDSIDQAIEDAMRISPTLLAAKFDLQASRQSKRIAQAGFLPSVTVEASSRRNTNVSALAGDSGDRSVMLFARWNLFRGGADWARQKSAAENINVSLESIEATRRVIVERLVSTWSAVEALRRNNLTLEEQVLFGEETLAAYKEQFFVGRRGLLDVLNAEQELFAARSGLMAGRYDEVLSAYQVHGAMGRLPDIFSENAHD